MLDLRRALPILFVSLISCGGGTPKGASTSPTSTQTSARAETSECPDLLDRVLRVATESDGPAVKVERKTFRASLLRVPSGVDKGQLQTFQASIEWPGATGRGSSGRPGPRAVDLGLFKRLTPAVAELLGDHVRREAELAKVSAFVRKSTGLPSPCGASEEELLELGQEITRGADAREGSLLRALNLEDHPHPADRVLLGYLTARSDRLGVAARGGDKSSSPPREAGFHMLASVSGDEKAPAETRALADYVLGRLFFEPERLGAALARTNDASLRLSIRRTLFDKWFTTGNLVLVDEAGLSDVLDDLTQAGDDAWAYGDLLRSTTLDPAGAEEAARFADIATRCVRSDAASEVRGECAWAIGARLAFFPDEDLWEAELPADQLASVTAALVRTATVLGDHEQTLFAAAVALERDPTTERKHIIQDRVATSTQALEQVKSRAWKEVFLARLEEVANRCPAPKRELTLTITGGGRRASVKVQPNDGELAACLERDGPRYFRSLPRVQATLRIRLPRP